MSKLFIFDCDGTLIDSEIVACRVFLEYWAKYDVHFTEDEFKEKFIGTGKDAPIVVETFKRLPPNAYEVGEELMKKAFETDLQAVRGIDDILANLKSEACVASNSSLDYVKQALKFTNLSQYFGDAVYSSRMVEKPKPAPDIFLTVAKKHGYEPEDCIVIEDSVSGVQAAQNAGMKVIAFSGAAHFTLSLRKRLDILNPTWVCTTSKELKKTLTSLD